MLPQFNKASAEHLHLLPYPAAVRIHETDEIAVAIGRSTLDQGVFMVTWFDRINWTVRRVWMSRTEFSPIPVRRGNMGAVASWEYEGCPHYSPRQPLTGIILDSREREGERQYLIKSDALNLPKWVNAAEVTIHPDEPTPLDAA